MSHRVVVVGGGFGGLPACRFLGHVGGIDVTGSTGGTITCSNLCSTRSPPASSLRGQIAPALRHVLRKLPNVTVELAEVTGFDLERRVVHAVRVPNVAIEVPYDSLIVAAGAGQSYFGHDEFAVTLVAT
jgi:NADH dehydrogenase